MPKAISYQGVAENEEGKVIKNGDLGLRFSLIDEADLTLYVENHTVTSTDIGHFTVMIGRGEIEQGDFENLKWDEDKLLLKVEIDFDGGTNYNYTLTVELNYIPYALVAMTSDNNPIGREGPQGIAGEIGPQGPAGPEGQQGEIGDRGSSNPGPSGLQGDKGPQGPPGPTGPHGLPGSQGDIGDTGSIGPTGAQGPQGIPGDCIAGTTGSSWLSSLQMVSQLPIGPSVNLYLDDGSNRADGQPGFRYYDGANWIDL